MFERRRAEVLGNGGMDLFDSSGKDSYDTEKSIYVLFVDDVVGFCGSARLNPMHTLSFLDSFFIEFQFEALEMWVCGPVVFHVNEDHPILENAQGFQGLAERFYQGLYQTLQQLSVFHHIPHILTFLPLSEHEDIHFFGKWPWKLQSKVEKAQNLTYALGVLSFSEESSPII